MLCPKAPDQFGNYGSDTPSGVLHEAFSGNRMGRMDSEISDGIYCRLWDVLPYSVSEWASLRCIPGAGSSSGFADIPYDCIPVGGVQ